MIRLLRTFSFHVPPLTDSSLDLRASQRTHFLQQKLILPGFIQSHSSIQYSKRNAKVRPSHWSTLYHEDILVSSVGLGSYIGSPEKDGLSLFNGVVESVLTGAVNVIDTAINYQYMRSEREIGAALRYLNSIGFKRDELLLCSKGGYIPHDFDLKKTEEQLVRQLVSQGKISESDVVNSIHCLHPNFLQNQLDNSLANLGVQTIDVYYLHNPAQNQLLLGKQIFQSRMKQAFEFLQKQRALNKIKTFGLATWLSFRAPPQQSAVHLNLQQVVSWSRQVGGQNHGLKFVQLPINLVMTESFGYDWQIWNNQKIPFLSAAHRQKINVISSSPLMQGALLNVPLPADRLKVNYNSAKNLQFIRSIPAPSLKSTLVGMKLNRHVKTNLQVCQQERLSGEEWVSFLQERAQKK